MRNDVRTYTVRFKHSIDARVCCDFRPFFASTRRDLL